MAGFPEYTLNKFLNILVDHNFTVVVVSQVTPPPKPKRSVTQILSPGTRIDNSVTFESNNIMSVYFDELCVGISIIDLSTGTCLVGEVASKANDVNYSLDEVYRLRTMHNPREIILFGNPGKRTFDELVIYLEIQDCCVHNKLHLYPKEFTNISFQNDFLRNIYSTHGLLTPIEYIDMERMPLASVSFIMVLNFAHSHNENITQKIKVPQGIFDHNTCVISYNAVQQLNIKSLLNILNNCSTPCGKRYFKDKLLNPTTNISQLNEIYDGIDIMMKRNDHKDTHVRHVIVSKLLSNIYDLERLFRKLRLKTLHPTDCLQIMTSIRWMTELEKSISSTSLYNEKIMKCVKEMLSIMSDMYDENELGKYHLDDITGSVFRRGYCTEIDDIQEKLNLSLDFFPHLASFLNKQTSDGFFKVDFNERDGNYLVITSKRFNEVKKKICQLTYSWENKKIVLDQLCSKSISSTSTSVKITHPFFTEIGQSICDLKAKLQSTVLSKYIDTIKHLETEYSDHFVPIVQHLSYIDYLCTCAQNASVFRYTRPILDASGGASFVSAEDLRHPIVERIQTNYEYIANDIELKESGVLLYGINSAGKSTLMKSLGLSIIMAQAGMYIPCSKMVLHPYNNIFTRIPSGDDIMKGHSTFTVEVLELRNILKRADKNSLVIGDELCSGTESVSALSIVSAGIIDLTKRGTSFIFATHLHDLTQISFIRDIKNLKVYHLSVHYDEDTGELKYNRKLALGQGNTLYGLEVCKSLGLGSEFISIANNVRKELLGIESVILSAQKSPYNSSKFISKCEICLANCDEVHHIKEQAMADDDGFIGSIHKNDKFNLICVCEKCHDAIHRRLIKVNGYVQTSNGIKLDYEVKQPMESYKIEEQKMIDIIEVLAKNGKKISEIINIMQKEHDLKVSRYKVNKILKHLSS
jgi:DNA mismatch repair protein MutS